jgi:hypothetical protein
MNQFSLLPIEIILKIITNKNEKYCNACKNMLSFRLINADFYNIIENYVDPINIFTQIINIKNYDLSYIYIPKLIINSNSLFIKRMVIFMESCFYINSSSYKKIPKLNSSDKHIFVLINILYFSSPVRYKFLDKNSQSNKHITLFKKSVSTFLNEKEFKKFLDITTNYCKHKFDETLDKNGTLIKAILDKFKFIINFILNNFQNDRDYAKKKLQTCWKNINQKFIDSNFYSNIYKNYTNVKQYKYFEIELFDHILHILKAYDIFLSCVKV